jgi:uracil-DNA glycosylase
VTLLVGAYAQRYYLNLKRPVSEVVARWREFLEDGFFPLPHPSPRNRKWLSDRPWFFKECVPALREIVREYLP